MKRCYVFEQIKQKKSDRFSNASAREKVNKLMQPRTIVKNKKNRMIEIVKKKPEE